MPYCTMERLSRCVNKDMQQYCANKSGCRKVMLLNYFDGNEIENDGTHAVTDMVCCDLCDKLTTH